MIENSGEVYLATLPKNPLASNDLVFTSSIYELVLRFSICFESKFNIPLQYHCSAWLTEKILGNSTLYIIY